MIIDCDLYVHDNFQCCMVWYVLGKLILLMGSLRVLKGENVVLIFHTGTVLHYVLECLAALLKLILLIITGVETSWDNFISV